MAACSQTSIVVSGAGLTNVNGTYISAGTEVVGGITFTRYTKDGDFNSLPRIIVRYSAGPGDGSWEIFDSVPIYGTNPIYITQYYNPFSLTPDCPDGLTFVGSGGPWGSAYDPAPTVTAGTPPAPDPYAPWGGFANYQRLRFLEYL